MKDELAQVAAGERGGTMCLLSQPMLMCGAMLPGPLVAELCAAEEWPASAPCQLGSTEWPRGLQQGPRGRRGGCRSAAAAAPGRHEAHHCAWAHGQQDRRAEEPRRADD